MKPHAGNKKRGAAQGFLAGALLCCVLAGCTPASPAPASSSIAPVLPAASQPASGDTEPRQEAVSPLDKPQPEAPPAEQHDFALVKARRVEYNFAGRDNGAYMLLPYEDGSEDIATIDYTSRKLTSLPALADVAGENALGSLEANGALTAVAFARDYLYHINYGAEAFEDEPFQPAVLTRMEPDGSKPMQIALPFGERVYFATAFLAEGNILYLMGMSGHREPDVCTLYKLDFAHQTCEPVKRFEQGRDVAIEAGMSDGILLRETIWPEATQPTESFVPTEPTETADPASPEAQPDAEAPPAETAPEDPLARTGYRMLRYALNDESETVLFEWQGSRSDTLLDENLLYYWEDSTQSILCTDLATGDNLLVATGILPEGMFAYDEVNLAQLIDNWLELGFFSTATEETLTLGLNVTTGKPVPAEEQAAQLTLPVLAQNDTWLLVQTGEYTGYVTAEDPELGTLTSSVLMPALALVTHGNYHAGLAELQPIEDTVTLY